LYANGVLLVFMKDTPRNTRFDQFLYEHWIGAITDDLRLHLANTPKIVAQATVSSSSSSSSSSSIELMVVAIRR
jgi:hypothetical protein